MQLISESHTELKSQDELARCKFYIRRHLKKAEESVFGLGEVFRAACFDTSSSLYHLNMKART